MLRKPNRCIALLGDFWTFESLQTFNSKNLSTLFRTALCFILRCPERLSKIKHPKRLPETVWMMVKRDSEMITASGLILSLLQEELPSLFPHSSSLGGGVVPLWRDTWLQLGEGSFSAASEDLRGLYGLIVGIQSWRIVSPEMALSWKAAFCGSGCENWASQLVKNDKNLFKKYLGVPFCESSIKVAFVHD